MSTKTLKDLASLVSGTLVGDPKLKIKGVSGLEEAKAGDLVFVLEEKYLSAALSSKASVLVAPEKSKIEKKSAILVKNPRLALAKILSLFTPKKAFKGIHKTSIVGKNTKIGKRVTIYPFVYVGDNCEIGDDTIIYPHVTIYDRVKIGKRVILHSGCRIGFDGYGFAQEAGRHIKIPQIGKVIIEDDVEIFSNVCIARGTLGATVIGQGTKIDALTHVAHNCKIGKDSALTALIGLAGSVTLGNRVYVGGQAGFSGHLTVGENTVIMARSGVTKDIPPNSVISGFPAQDHHQEMKFQAELRRLTSRK